MEPRNDTAQPSRAKAGRQEGAARPIRRQKARGPGEVCGQGGRSVLTFWPGRLTGDELSCDSSSSPNSMLS